MRTINCAFILSLILISNACAGSDNPDENQIPTSINLVANDQYEGPSGTTFTLSASVLDQNGVQINSSTLAWTSSNTDAASVSNKGTLTIHADGAAIITVTSESLSEETTVDISILENLIAFSAKELSTQLAGSGNNTLTFLEETTMTGVYGEYAIGQTMAAADVGNDQIYYFLEGMGKMSINGVEVNIEPQMSLFIAGNSSRSITEVTVNLKFVQTTINKSFSQNTSPFLKHTRAQMISTRNSSTNVWNQFLNQPSASFGMYMLPKATGGDGRLVHPFDEINIITSGSSTFETDAGMVTVEPGSIVYVREANGHFFKSLNEDIDILILWNK